MTTITRPNVRPIAAVVVGLLAIGVLGFSLAKFTKADTAQAGAQYVYKSEPQWYNGPVARPAISGKYMAFVTLWEGNGWNLYVSDMDRQKDYKISLDGAVSHAIEPSVSSNYVAWSDAQNNKWQVRLFDLYSYNTQTVANTMNEIGRPSVSEAKVVWREANFDQPGQMIQIFDQPTQTAKTLAAGKSFSDPVIAGNFVTWFQNDSTCNTNAYRLCTPTDSKWNLVVYNLGLGSVETIATNIETKYAPTITNSQIIWSQKVGGQYDLFRYSFANGKTDRLTNTAIEEASPVTSGNRVAYVGIPQNGGQSVVHVFDMNKNEDIVMPHKKASQQHVGLSETRVVWSEVDADSRIHVYDFKMDATESDVDHDGLTTAEETKKQTDDMNKDSDGDGIPDTDEVVLFQTNPSAIDSDGDGLNDYQELFVYHSSPTKFDTDGDGYNDGVEIANSYSPTNPKPVKVAKNFYKTTAYINAAMK